MSAKSPIQWTDTTWNPVIGCKRVSAGCDNCYAFQLHDQRYIAWKRGRWDSAPAQYHQPFSRVQLMPQRLGDPLHWRKPRHVFVNSMSDLFHPDVPDEFIARIFAVMAHATDHTFQILTKRPDRMRAFMQNLREGCVLDVPRHGNSVLDTLLWGCYLLPLPNVWLGVSVEHQEAADERIPLLLETPAAVRFLSCEPLLAPVDLEPYLTFHDRNGEPFGLRQRLQWVIIGGESGSHARALDVTWAESLIWQCQESGVAPFVKQLGAVWAKANHSNDHHGGDMSEWPEHLRMREFPKSEACRQWQPQPG